MKFTISTITSIALWIIVGLLIFITIHVGFSEDKINSEPLMIEYNIKQAMINIGLSEHKVEIYPKIIAYACKKYNVDWKEAFCLICMESYFDTYAIGDSLPRFTKERARGPLQTLPSTAKSTAGILGFPYHKYATEHNPVFGFIAGIYLYSNNKLIWGNQEQALKAYILGNKRLRDYYKKNKRAVKLYKLAKIDESWERFCRFYNSLEEI